MTGKLVCLDPGFASVGYAVLLCEGDTVTLSRFGLCRTKKSTDGEVYASDDNLRRAVEVSAALRALLLGDNVPPLGFCVEAFSFPRNASNAAKVALTWGVLACLSESLALPLWQAPPMEVKEALTGDRSATKEDVQAAIAGLYPAVLEMRRALPRGQWEHPHDALAAGHFLLGTDAVRRARGLPAKSEVTYK